jgi:predicted amidophosphoribosyltransferase
MSWLGLEQSRDQAHWRVCVVNQDGHMSFFHRVRESLFATWHTRCPLCSLGARAGLLCAGCERDCYDYRQARALCIRCANDLIPALNNPAPQTNALHCSEICLRCQQQPPAQAYAVCAMDYAFPAGWLMSDFKARARLSLARPMAHVMLKAAQRPMQIKRPCAWIPVPASAQRLQTLGFSPPQQLAWHMGRLSGIATKLHWLSRAGNASPQKHRTRSARQSALIGAMVASPAVAGRWGVWSTMS